MATLTVLSELEGLSEGITSADVDTNGTQLDLSNTVNNTWDLLVSVSNGSAGAVVITSKAVASGLNARGGTADDVILNATSLAAGAFGVFAFAAPSEFGVTWTITSDTDGEANLKAAVYRLRKFVR